MTSNTSPRNTAETQKPAAAATNKPISIMVSSDDSNNGLLGTSLPDSPTSSGGSIRKKELLIIANRLPVKVKSNSDGSWSFQRSEGGLATGLASLPPIYDKRWLGWPGVNTCDPGKQAAISAELEKLDLHSVFLDDNLYDHYYKGFSNKIIWPLFHLFNNFTQYNQEYWEAYIKVNEMFAERAQQMVNDDTIIWVQDYHLMLLPALLRQRLPNAKIAFFLHIPFPPFELFKSLPYREELLRGLIGADLVALHTFSYMKNFLASCNVVLGLDTSLGRLEDGQHSVLVEAFPMGVDYKQFVEVRHSPEVVSAIEWLRGALLSCSGPEQLGAGSPNSGCRASKNTPLSARSRSSSSASEDHSSSSSSKSPRNKDSSAATSLATAGQQEPIKLSEFEKEVEEAASTFSGCKLILTIDRLDYSKGIINRLHTYEQFLRQHPELHGKVVMLKLVVPSRAEIDSYQSLKDEIDKVVGRVTGDFSTPEWRPIVYLYRSLPFHQLVALYSLAHVCWVTSLHDGMNLVAKEYVACRARQDGVLLLSEMAGAAEELSQALLVNPHDQEAMVRALHQALLMPIDEQHSRMVQLQRVVSEQTLQKWANDNIRTLEEVCRGTRLKRELALEPLSKDQIFSLLKKSKRRLFLLDYDGTLMPFFDKPEDARPDERLVRLLRQLSKQEATKVVVISGRSHETLEEWLGETGIDMVAEHGAWYKCGGQHSRWEPAVDDDNSWQPSVLQLMTEFVEKTPRSFVEHKTFSLVWHYRQCDEWLGDMRARQLKEALDVLVDHQRLSVLLGHKVIEVKVAAYNKGLAAKAFAEAADYDFVLVAGDDATDEDMFSALKDTTTPTISVKVGLAQSTAARYRLESFVDVRKLLDGLRIHNLGAGVATRQTTAETSSPFRHNKWPSTTNILTPPVPPLEARGILTRST